MWVDVDDTHNRRFSSVERKRPLNGNRFPRWKGSYGPFSVVNLRRVSVTYQPHPTFFGLGNRPPSWSGYRIKCKVSMRFLVRFRSEVDFDVGCRNESIKDKVSEGMSKEEVREGVTPWTGFKTGPRKKFLRLDST